MYGTYTADVCTCQGVFGDGRFNGTMQNVVGPTLVAMATKFGLGAESSRLPACYYNTQDKQRESTNERTKEAQTGGRTVATSPMLE